MKILSSVILSLIFLVFWSCSDYGEPKLDGCTDPSACNYDEDATEDDGSCIADLDICGTCGGTIVFTADCCEEGQISDCSNVCGGPGLINTDGECCVTGVIDDCSVCGGDNSTCVNFSTEIKPLFSNCTSCHGGYGGLSLSTYNSLIIGGNSGAVVTPGDGSGSRLVKKLRGTASGDRMPQGGVYWNDTNINLIETWINEGALNN